LTSLSRFWSTSVAEDNVKTVPEIKPRELPARYSPVH